MASDPTSLPLVQLRGRGAADNPPNRFERLHVEPELDDGWTDADAPADAGPRTQYFHDASRSVIARNDSPDVGFTHSLNPYRGCEHGCSYCLDGATSILLADGRTRPLREIKVGDAILGTRRIGWYRRLERTEVFDHWYTWKPAYRVSLADGTELVCSADHQFLTERGWKHVTGAEQGRDRRPHLTVGNHLMGYGAFASPPARSADRDRGYLAGLIRGDGAIGTHSNVGRRRSPDVQQRFRLALADDEALARGERLLQAQGINVCRFRFAAASETRREITAIRIGTEAGVGAVRRLIQWPATPSEDWDRGFLAGIFDAEGSCGEGLALKAPSAGLRVVEIQRLGVEMELFDITTGTGDFIANGVVSHNCYARPTHEYLGYSAGLDFESRILVKRDAPRLLREALSSPRWTPTPLAMSGVTDPYQPVERRLRITRGCLEVLAEFRNPVGIITKNRLVARDADLLGELAAVGAARVMLSITSLDEAVQRAMEPRASAPRLRLEAIEALARAGVPVGVIAAPMIPGLTDHELPAILAAAAGAGATSAAWIPIRLPGAVAGVFEAWLRAHFPDRADKVMGRIRGMRGGRVNDPRFGARMRGEGPHGDQLRALFQVTVRRLGLNAERAPLSTASFRRAERGGQMSLFG